MTEIEKTYISGIIDGERRIMPQSFHQNQLPAPCVYITSTTTELLIWIKEKSNTGTITKKKNYTSEKYRDCYTLTIKHDAPLRFLEEITPYLVIQTK